MCDDPDTLLFPAATNRAARLMTDDQATVEAMISIQKRGGAVRTVRSDAGLQFMAGAMRLSGLVIADLINLKWIIPDGPRDYRLFETSESW